MFHRTLLGVPDLPLLFPTTLVTESGTPCADPRCGSWFGRMAEQSPRTEEVDAIFVANLVVMWRSARVCSR